MRSHAVEIVARLQQAGFEALFVGGCVRDQLLGKEPQDYDIATSARPEEIEHLFPRTFPVGRKFGVLLVHEGGFDFQVATFRTESGYQDGRHPDAVVFADAQADARRRDFTVNGLFLDPVENRLFDWVGGQADLRAGIIRTIGSPAERFAEDHLRLLRAVRFAAQLGFAIEPATFDSLRQLAPTIADVSAERIRDELCKLFRPPHAAIGLEGLRGSGLMPHVFPELVDTIGCQQSPDYHPEGTVFEHIRRMLALLPDDAPALLPWAVLLHDIAKPCSATTEPVSGEIHFYGHERTGAEMAERILTRLRFPSRAAETVVACVRYHMRFKDVRQMRRSTVRRMLLRPTFPLELELHRLDCLGSHGRLDHYEFLVAQQKELESLPALRPPLIRGEDLLALGLEPGPRIGQLLDLVREEQLEEELSNREQALEWVRQQLEAGGNNR